jgi:hypothetical protein
MGQVADLPKHQSYVRFGPQADITASIRDVRSSPKSGTFVSAICDLLANYFCLSPSRSITLA